MPHPPFIDYRRRLKTNARAMRRDLTPAERRLWFEFLSALPQRFTRQKPLGTYIADFYCASRMLVIEVDGDSHYDAAGARRDQVRTLVLEKQGIRVMRFSNAEVMDTFEGVCEQIEAALEGRKP
jgi:very-short-patch-repair endonuclease